MKVHKISTMGNCVVAVVVVFVATVVVAVVVFEMHLRNGQFQLLIFWYMAWTAT